MVSFVFVKKRMISSEIKVTPKRISDILSGLPYPESILPDAQLKPQQNILKIIPVRNMESSLVFFAGVVIFTVFAGNLVIKS